VEVVEVDRVRAEPSERLVNRSDDMCGPRVVHERVSAVRSYEQPDLRGDPDAVAERCERLPDELLVRERPVDVGGVEVRDAQLERPPDQRYRFVVGLAEVRERHRHAAEPDAAERLAGLHPAMLARGAGFPLGGMIRRWIPAP